MSIDTPRADLAYTSSLSLLLILRNNMLLKTCLRTAKTIVISSKEGSEADVSNRIGIARGIFHALSKVWTSKDIKKSMKIEVFEILVLSSLLYNSETWCMKAVSKHRIKFFEIACLRKIEGVTKKRQTV